MSNDPGQGSWSSICTDHLTAFSLKHLLLLLRTSFHLKSLDELAVFRRNHLPPGKREWGFCSVRAEGSLCRMPTSLLSLRALTPTPGTHRPVFRAQLYHLLLTGLPGLELTDPQNGNKNHIVLKRLDWGWNNSVSWGGQHRPGPPKLDKIPPLGTSQVSACPTPPKPTQQVSGSSPFHDSQPSWAILTILPPDLTLLPPSLPLRQLSTMATAQWASCFQLHPSPRPSDPAVLSSTHLTALLLSPGQTMNLKGSST